MSCDVVSDESRSAFWANAYQRTLMCRPPTIPMPWTPADTGAALSWATRGRTQAQAQDASLKRACRPLSLRSQVAGDSPRERRDGEAQERRATG
jgi:hypothetical protein